MCDALRDLVYLCNLKNLKNTHSGVLLFTFSKVAGYWCFSHFLNWTNGTKWCKALHLSYTLLFYQPKKSLHYHLIFLMKDTSNCFSRNFLFSMGCFLSCLLWKIGLIFPGAYFCDLGIFINFHSTQICVTS